MRSSRLSGQITVFLSLLLTIFISLIFSLFYSAIISGKRTMAENAIDLTMDSIFAQYNRKLLDDYDLFYIDMNEMGIQANKEGLSDKYISLLKENIDYENKAPYLLGADNFLSLKLSNVDASILKYSVASDNKGYVYRQQAINYMKTAFPEIMLKNVKERLKDKEYGADVNLDKKLSSANSSIENAKKDDKSYKEVKDKKAYDNYKKHKKNKKKSDNKIKRISSKHYYDINPANINTDFMGYVNNMKAGGILGKVWNKNISSRAVDKYRLISKRGSINTGDGFYKDFRYNNYQDKLLFNEYLLEHFSNAINNKGNRALEYEIEYFLYGKESDVKNLRAVADNLLLIRSGANYLHIVSDSEKKSEAEGLAALIATLLFSPEATDAVAQLIMGVWAFGESMLDVKDLFDGKRVPIIKTKQTFKLQLSNITNVFSQNYEECKDPTALDYKDYLRILLLINNQKNNVLRSMDLIEANLTLYDEHKNFKMDSCVEFIDLDIHFFIGKDIKYNKKFGYIQ